MEPQSQNDWPQKILSLLKSGQRSVVNHTRDTQLGQENGLIEGFRTDRRTPKDRYASKFGNFNSEFGQNSGLEVRLQADRATSTGDYAIRLVRKLLQIVVGCLSLLWFLLPRRGRPVRRKARHELHPLAYLDALRGYLALIIFTGHTMPIDWKWIPDSITSIPWFQFPFRGGWAALDIFFWISGYTMTYRLIGFIQAKRTDLLLDALASSVFRRYFRLLLPVFPVTLVTIIAIKLGIAIPPEDKMKKMTGNFLWYWIKDSAHVLNPFTHILGYWDGATGSELLDPFWSLSAEFRSSMILFTFCTGTCKLSSKNRKRLIWILIPAFMCWQAQWASMAFLGMWFAERRQQRRREQDQQHASKDLRNPQSLATSTTPSLDTTLNEKYNTLEREKSSLPFSTHLIDSFNTKIRPKYTTTAQRFREPFLILLFAYSFILFKNPRSIDKKTGFPHTQINNIVPAHWHPQMRMHLHLMIGSFLLLYPLDQLSILQWPLLTEFSQYLGELSFGIYAVHFPVRWIVWEPRYVKWQKERHGNDAMNHFWIAFPGYFCMAVLVLWSADLFRRLDMQVVKLCKNLELWFFE